MDYAELLNTVQRHTRCSTQYFFRHKQNEKELSCRFHFPFEYCAETHLNFEQVNSKNDSLKYRTKIITKRNDSCLNSNQCTQLQGWRANCDIQIIVDYHACVEYLTKYASKPEQKSTVVHQTLSNILKSATTSETDKIMKKLMMKVLGERDFSTQETMHHLLSPKL